MNIRRMMHQDMQEVHSYFSGEHDYQSYRVTKSADVLVADDQGEILGILVACTDGSTCEVVHIEVRDDRWGEGIGSEMLAYLEGLCDESISMECTVGERDGAMQMFMKANGFTVSNDIINLSGEPAYLFRKGWRFVYAPQVKYRFTG